MKTAPSLLVAVAGASAIAASPLRISDGADSHFRPIALGGEDYIPGPSLFPGQVIAGYNAEISEYNADSWAQHVMEQCESFPACTVSASYSGINSGSTGGRYWFGYIFRGGPANASNFQKAENSSEVEGARAYRYDISVLYGLGRR